MADLPKTYRIKSFGCQMNVYDGERMAELLDSQGLRAAGRRPVDTDMPAIGKFDALPARRRVGPSAFLTVQEGCDKFCTYCVVPYTRGAEISRPRADIIAEAQALVDGGAREITLLGQNVNAYDGGLDVLIRELARIDGLERIRYTTSHPADMSDALIAAHGEIDKLMPFLHLPVQSGSDRILKAMNRSHTAETYLKTLERVRAARSDIAISGDFIVGFPGESDEDFTATLAIVDAVGYASAYSFKYSARPGTPAATMEGAVPAYVMDERLQRLQAKIAEHSLAFNRATIGRDTQILIDRKGRLPGQMIGKSPWLQSVFVETDAPIGTMLDVTVMQALPNSLGGILRDRKAAS